MSATTLKNDDYFIGKFKVIRVLGRGSEGVVYLAMDTKLNREVAIKTTTLGESPDPLLATTTTDSRIPVPDYVEYQDQAEELDKLTAPERAEHMLAQLKQHEITATSHLQALKTAQWI